MGLFSGSKSYTTGFDTGNRGSIGSNNLLPTLNINGSKNNANIINNITATDYGAIEQATNIIGLGLASINDAVLSVTDTVGDTLNTVVDVVLGTTADNKELAQNAMDSTLLANENVTAIASEAQNNNAYLTDLSISGNQSLASQFGSDVAILASDAMVNNAILVSETVDTVEVLATQHQDSLNFMGEQLSASQSQHAADVGYLTSQSIQANSELTALYMSGLSDNAALVNNSLMELSERQERGLDAALEVAGNVALDDSVEGLKEIFKYLSIAGAVVGVVYAYGKVSK